MNALPRVAALLALVPRGCAVLGVSSLAALAGAGWTRAVLLMIAVALGGCAALPGPGPLAVSHAIDADNDSGLARIAAVSRRGAPSDLSGFRLLADGEEAFRARIALIRRAERSIDAQYYLIADDRSGHEFLRELRAAAGRGVRVRVLVDDLYESGQDGVFAGFAAHQHVELRLFNPLPARRGGTARRIAFSLHELARVNHRMHDKLLVVDNAMAISGGRNIADLYFERGGTTGFIDVDVLATGPVVAELSAVFDSFWNSEHAYPVGTLADPPATPWATPPTMPSWQVAAATRRWTPTPTPLPTPTSTRTPPKARPTATGSAVDATRAALPPSWPPAASSSTWPMRASWPTTPARSTTPATPRASSWHRCSACSAAPTPRC